MLVSKFHFVSEEIFRLIGVFSIPYRPHQERRFALTGYTFQSTKSTTLIISYIFQTDPLQHEDCTALIPRTKNGNLAVESDNPNVKRYYFEQAQNVVQISGIANTGGKKKNLTSFRLPGTWRNPHVYAVPGQICSLLLDYDDKYAGGSEAGRIGALADAQVSLERILASMYSLRGFYLEATPYDVSIPSILPVSSSHASCLHNSSENVPHHLLLCSSLPVPLLVGISVPFLSLSCQCHTLTYHFHPSLRGYWGILLMAITAFVMWGFESMGLELENPFG